MIAIDHKILYKLLFYIIVKTNAKFDQVKAKVLAHIFNRSQKQNEKKLCCTKLHFICNNLFYNLKKNVLN